MSLERLKGKLVSVAFKKEIQWQEDRSGKRLIFFYCIDFYIF